MERTEGEGVSIESAPGHPDALIKKLLFCNTRKVKTIKYSPLQGSNRNSRLAAGPDKSKVGLLLLLESCLDQVQWLNKDACTEA